MIQAYVKLFGNTNKSYIFENPVKSNFIINRGEGDIAYMPTLDMATLFRQSFLANEALQWLTHTFKDKFYSPELYVYMIGYTNKNITAEHQTIHELSVARAKNRSKILIYLDFCLDNDDWEWQEIKGAFLESQSESEIFLYSELMESEDKRQELQDLITALRAGTSTARTTLSVSPSTLSLYEGDTGSLTITTNASDYTATMGDDTIATFDKNTSQVTALNEGSTSLTITAQADGATEKTSNVSIAVTAVKLTGIEVETQPTKTKYYVGDTIDLSGLTLKCTYNNGTTTTIDSGYTYTPETIATAGDISVAIIYEGQATMITLTAEEVTLTGLSVKTEPTKTDYTIGDSIDLSGLVLEASYNNGETKEVDSGYTYDIQTADAEGELTITITYEGLTATIKVNVEKPETTLVLSSDTIEITEGDTGEITVETNADSIQVTDNNGDIATSSVSDKTITITGVAIGDATFTVTAQADGCKEATATITATIESTATSARLYQAIDVSLNNLGAQNGSSTTTNQFYSGVSMKTVAYVGVFGSLGDSSIPYSSAGYLTSVRSATPTAINTTALQKVLENNYLVGETGNLAFAPTSQPYTYMWFDKLFSSYSKTDSSYELLLAMYGGSKGFYNWKRMGGSTKDNIRDNWCYYINGTIFKAVGSPDKSMLEFTSASYTAGSVSESADDTIPSMSASIGSLATWSNSSCAGSTDAKAFSSTTDQITAKFYLPAGRKDPSIYKYKNISIRVMAVKVNGIYVDEAVLSVVTGSYTRGVLSGGTSASTPNFTFDSDKMVEVFKENAPTLTSGTASTACKMVEISTTMSKIANNYSGDYLLTRSNLSSLSMTFSGSMPENSNSMSMSATALKDDTEVTLITLYMLDYTNKGTSSITDNFWEITADNIKANGWYKDSSWYSNILNCKVYTGNDSAIEGNIIIDNDEYSK